MENKNIFQDGIELYEGALVLLSQNLHLGKRCINISVYFGAKLES